jgi:hypothetical protein
MPKVIEIYSKNFMLTGENYDPRDLDFTFYTQEKITLNPEGNPSMKEYYMNYDAGTGTFSDLAVQCTFTYIYDGATLIRREENIDWYFTDGTIGANRQLTHTYA